MSSKFKYFEYFKTPTWQAQFPGYIKLVDKVCDEYIKDAKKKAAKDMALRKKFVKKNMKDFGMSFHSTDLYKDPRLKSFVDFVGIKSCEFLEWCGFDLRNFNPHFSEMWVQEFAKSGGGHHNTHVHYNNHVSGFYFLKCSPKTSFPVLHDPRPGAMMTKLPQKNVTKLSYANEAITFKPSPGTLIIFPAYVPHEFVLDGGTEPFRFIHFNIVALPR